MGHKISLIIIIKKQKNKGGELFIYIEYVHD